MQYYCKWRNYTMTCPHLKFSIINKSQKHNNSLFATLSYNSRTVVYDEAAHRKFYPHTKSDDCDSTAMLLPTGAPEAYHDAEKCFNDINNLEKGKIAYKLIIPFQRELSFDENKELIIRLLRDEYVSQKHPVHIAIHRGKNGNDHIHALVIDRRLVNGTWEPSKSTTAYYRRGTVKEINDHGKVINPDAELLSEDKKTDKTPVLKRRKLQYDKDGNIIYTKGWKELQFDKSGKPLLDADGYPILLDIREPDYDPVTGEQKISKNGKYEKPQWKKTTIKHSNISDFNNIKKFRQKWQDLQNEYFKKNGIVDEHDKPLTVDLRSYRYQNENRPQDEQLIPTRHVFRSKHNKSLDDILNDLVQYNANAKKHNEHVKALRAKKYETFKLQKELEALNKRITANDTEDINFFHSINPRKTFISDYDTYYKDMMRRQKRFISVFEKHIADNLLKNDNAIANNDKSTPRGKEKDFYLHRHNFALYALQRKLSRMMPSVLDVRKKAAEIYDAFSNKDIVAYTGKRFGQNFMPLAARVLERTRPDGTNPFDAKISDAPFSPDVDTNSKCLQTASKHITGNPDYNKMQKQAFSEWDDKEGQTAPATVHDMMSVYLTASGYYDARLTGKTWTTVSFGDSRNEADNINQQYAEELAKITQKEELELQSRKTEEPKQNTSATVDHEAVHKRMGKENDELFDSIISIANNYSDIDINTIVYAKGENAGKPYRAKQSSYIRKLAGRIPKSTGIQDKIALWDKNKEERDIYYHKYIKGDYDDWIKTQTQKLPADLTPDNSGNRSKDQRLT